MGGPPELNDTERQVQALLDGLLKRAELGATDPARAELESDLLQRLQLLHDGLDGVAVAPETTIPPRRVATAMALALHSQPHIAVTLGGGDEDGTCAVEERAPYPCEASFVVPSEVLEVCLGLSQWELDDLREDIDRRAGRALKRRLALRWMWNHFGLPDSRPAPLFRVLFPALDRRAGKADLACRSGRLYALLDVPEMPLPSMYLGWMGSGVEGAAPPLASFRARYVDQGLRRSLARGIGADPHEVDGLLDRTVVLVPRDAAATYLERDQWRSAGYAAMTALGDDYLGAENLLDPAEREELEWERWLTVDDGVLRVARPAKALFDELALSRAQTMLQQIYAGLLSRVEQTDAGDDGFRVEDLDLLDLPSHLRAALTPLIEWGRTESTIAHVATRMRARPDSVADALETLSQEWEHHLETRWLKPPSVERRHTIPGIVFTHLIALRSSLIRLALREPDRRWEHRSLCLLFAAHYLADAPIERLWLKGLSDMLMDDATRMPPPEDIVGCWFWPTWQRLLDVGDIETRSTLIR